MTGPTPTLLVFTLGATAERERRGLLPQGLAGLEVGLHRSCLAAVLEAGRLSGLRLEICSPEVPGLRLPDDVAYRAQARGSFGARLSAALSGAFAAGGPVLVVGTDIPELSVAHLDRARALLAEREDRVVVGPSPDGGVYLIGANRPVAGLDTQVRWRRREALSDLLRLLAAAGREVVLLAPLADLDRPADLDAWLYRAVDPRWRVTVRGLRRALARHRRSGAVGPFALPASPTLCTTPGRAPPRPAF
jgi:2-phospho-L-lactate guanylyltransferase (CobY/MobA/RfbA family)